MRPSFLLLLADGLLKFTSFSPPPFDKPFACRQRLARARRGVVGPPHGDGLRERKWQWHVWVALRHFLLAPFALRAPGHPSSRRHFLPAHRPHVRLCAGRLDERRTVLARRTRPPRRSSPSRPFSRTRYGRRPRRLVPSRARAERLAAGSRAALRRSRAHDVAHPQRAQGPGGGEEAVRRHHPGGVERGSQRAPSLCAARRSVSALDGWRGSVERFESQGAGKEGGVGGREEDRLAFLALLSLAPSSFSAMDHHVIDISSRRGCTAVRPSSAPSARAPRASPPGNQACAETRATIQRA